MGQLLDPHALTVGLHTACRSSVLKGPASCVRGVCIFSFDGPSPFARGRDFRHPEGVLKSQLCGQ